MSQNQVNVYYALCDMVGAVADRHHEQNTSQKLSDAAIESQSSAYAMSFITGQMELYLTPDQMKAVQDAIRSRIEFIRENLANIRAAKAKQDLADELVAEHMKKV